MTRVDSGEKKPRQITGGMVLAGLIAFFGTVMLVDFNMARLAVSTFAGLETESSYKAGLVFSKEASAARQQEARNWQVNVDLGALGGEGRQVTVRVVDAEGKPLSNLVADGRFAHPTDARRDVKLELNPVGDGRYRASAEAGPGQWDLIIDFAQGGERLFRSRNRVQLP
ncbi:MULTISPECIES: FixH family protein [unclassified Xanthobacter]|uniref:FixH family protein n=1 Tax=unclassified Xanthobacter TaxID=2623496 RepID=UPI001EDD692C|nr:MULTISPECIES: FixH family protein [unclassified Xanthobacter]